MASQAAATRANCAFVVAASTNGRLNSSAYAAAMPEGAVFLLGDV